MLAPTGTPPEVIRRLAAEVRKIAETPEMYETLLRVGLLPVQDTPENMKSTIVKHSAMFGALVEELGLKME